MSDLMQIRAEDARDLRNLLNFIATGPMVLPFGLPTKTANARDLLDAALADHERIRGRAGAEGEVAR